MEIDASLPGETASHLVWLPLEVVNNGSAHGVVEREENGAKMTVIISAQTG
jgi:hypothetical protein